MSVFVILALSSNRSSGGLPSLDDNHDELPVKV